MLTTIALLVGFAAFAQTAEKTQIVSVTGCLKESAPNTWTVINATDPVPSRAGASTQAPTGPMSGKNEFKLIGVLEFNLAAHKDRTVVVKGLFVKAAPVSRINITSVRAVTPNCGR